LIVAAIETKNIRTGLLKLWLEKERIRDSNAPGINTELIPRRARGDLAGPIVQPVRVRLAIQKIANFTALHKYYIAGRVVDSAAAGVGGFALSLSGSRSASTMTFSNGNYVFTELPEGGEFTVTPSGVGYVSNPISLSFSSLKTHKIRIGDASILARASASDLS